MLAPFLVVETPPELLARSAGRVPAGHTDAPRRRGQPTLDTPTHHPPRPAHAGHTDAPPRSGPHAEHRRATWHARRSTLRPTTRCPGSHAEHTDAPPAL